MRTSNYMTAHYAFYQMTGSRMRSKARCATAMAIIFMANKDVHHMKETIHQYDNKLRLKLARIANSSLSQNNKKVILAFKDECFVMGLSKGRVLKYLYYLSMLASWLGKDFETAKQEDLKTLVGKVEQSEYANSSKKELKICIRKLYKFLRNTEEYPPIVKWIRPFSSKTERLILPEDMLTENDITKLINTASNQRDKAFVATLYESGCRISELLLLKIRRVRFDENGTIIVVPNIKTGSRRVRLISSVPLLTDWINNHPRKDNPNEYLWPSNKGEVISYGHVRNLLLKLAQKSGIKKRVNPHNFRHSRATYLANYLTEAQMKEHFGWIQASDMAAIYVHLSGRDVDTALFKVYGKKVEEKPKESILTPKTCNRCKQQNPSNNHFCSKCGMPLDKETMNQVIREDFQRRESDSIMNQMFDDPRFKALFEEKMREINENKT